MVLCIIAIIGINSKRSYSQVGIGATQFTPNTCSMLEIQATNKGILIPRIDYNSKPASPADGCLIYVIANGPSGNNAFYYYNAGTSSWVMLAGGNSLSGTGTNGYASYWTGTNTLGSEQYLNISRGGTGLGSTPTNGQLLIGNGTNYTLANLTGTNNQITVTNGAGGITLSTPQNINTVSSPTFASLTLTNPLGLSSGGTNASLTANNGGIVWSNASQLQILNGTATVNQMLMSGASSAPTWSTAVYPANTTANQLLYSSANNNITGLTTAPGGILNTSATSVPSITATPTLGVANTIGGALTLEGSLSGAVTIQPPTTIPSAYNFVLPTSAGTSGQVLLSGGGGAMTWSSSGSLFTIPINNLIAATAANTIDNTNFAQNWQWNSLGAGNGLALSSTAAGATGNLFSITSSATAPTGGIADFNFAAHTGSGFQIDDATTNGNAIQLNANSATTGNGLAVSATAAGLTGNALSVTTGSTGTPANGLVRFNFNGARTTAGSGFQIDDISTTLATIMKINGNSLTTGNGLAISATAAGLTGNALSVTTGSTGTPTNGLVEFNFNGARTTAGSGFQIDDISTTLATVMKINGNSLTSGIGLALNTNLLTSGTGMAIASTSTAMTGSLANITLSGSNAANTGNLLSINSSGAASVAKALLVTTTQTVAPATGLVQFNFNGNRIAATPGFEIDDISTTLATTMKINSNSLTTGNGLAISATAAGLTGNALSVTTGSTGTPTNGLVEFNFNGARTTAGSGFQIDDISTTLATVMKINGNSLSTGTGLALNTNLLTSGTGMAIASTSTAMTGSLANITLSGSNAANTGSLLSITSSGAASIGNAFLTTSNATAPAAGIVRFNLTGTHSGNGFQIDDATATGTAAAFGASALTTGSILNVSTSNNTWLGNATTNGLVNISSTSTGGTAGSSSMLLNLSRSGANTNASHTAYGLYSSITNSGATNTNVAGYFSATGATNNYGIVVPNGNVGVGTSTPTDKLDVAAGVTLGNNIVNATGSINDFLEYNIQNTSNGTGAQSGFSATADNGTNTTNFAWMGINSSTFNNPQQWNIGLANDVSFMGFGQNMYISNMNTTQPIIFTTGTAISPYYTERMRITNAGNVGIGISTPNSTLQVSGGVSMPIVTQTTNYSVLATDHTVIFSGITAGQTISLPAVSAVAGTGNVGRVYFIVNISNQTLTLNVTGGGTTILPLASGSSAVTSITINAGTSVTVQSNGTYWYVIK